MIEILKSGVGLGTKVNFLAYEFLCVYVFVYLFVKMYIVCLLLFVYMLFVFVC